MKIFLSSLGLLCSQLIWAQPMAYFDYKVFNTLSNGTYVETYLDFSSESLNYTPLPDSTYQAKVLTTIIILQDTNIVNFSKLEIKSPNTKDSIYIDFMNLQRFPLSPGNYTIEIELTDLNRSQGNTTKFQQLLVVPSPSPSVYISDIMFVGDIQPASKPGPFTKGNQDLMPLVSDYYPQDLNKFMFHAEIYNSHRTFYDSSAAFICLYKIANPRTGAPFRSFQKMIRQKAAPIIPLVASLDISGLPSGNFDLVIEIRNSRNELITSNKRSFQRSNLEVVISDAEMDQLLLDNSFVGNLTSIDSLQEYIYCLRPIATEKEKLSIDAQKDFLPTLDMKKRFFYGFWANRNAIDPSADWQDYKKEVAVANKLFKTRIKMGYETDRGRVYLQYGPPNTRTERPTEPSSYPYEIWHYYKIKQFSNKRFVFYNQDLVSNDYELLHSDLFGEIKNANWQNYLSKRNSSIDNPDKRAPEDQFGGRSNDFFLNPR